MSMRIEDNISVPAVDALSGHIEQETIKRFSLDRVAGDKLKLPYSFDKIKLNPNSILSAPEINKSLNRLYHNFL